MISTSSPSITFSIYFSLNNYLKLLHTKVTNNIHFFNIILLDSSESLTAQNAVSFLELLSS